MITYDMLHNVIFKKSFRGYNVVEVDRLLETIEEQLQQDSGEILKLKEEINQLQAGYQDIKRKTDSLNSEKEDCTNENIKLRRECNALREENIELNNRIRDLLREGDGLKDAFVKANRISMMMEQEANEKAEKLLTDTRQKSDQMLQESQQRADRMIRDAESRKSELDMEYKHLCGEMSEFKERLISALNAEIDRVRSLPDHAEKDVPDKYNDYQEHADETYLIEEEYNKLLSFKNVLAKETGLRNA